MKLPIITSAIIALSLMAPSLASQAEGAGAGAAKTGTATEEGKVEGEAQHNESKAHGGEPEAKYHAKRHKRHVKNHSPDCGRKSGEPCAPGHFCEDK